MQPRVPQAVLDRLHQAEKSADLGSREKSRLLMQAKRDREAGRLSDEGCRRHEQLGRDRRSSAANLQFLRDWAAGRLSASVTRKESATVTAASEDRADAGWLNYHELLAHHGGHVSDGQKRYVDRLWRAAAARGEREHPDGPSLPKRRRFNLAQLESQWTRKEQRHGAHLQLPGEASTDLEGFLEQEDPQLPPDSAAGEGPEGPKGPEGPTKKPVKELTRADLLLEHYKVLPRLAGLLDSVPEHATWRGVVQAQLQPSYEGMLASKSSLELQGVCTSETLASSAAALQRGQATLSSMGKLINQLKHLA